MPGKKRKKPGPKPKGGYSGSAPKKMPTRPTSAGANVNLPLPPMPTPRKPRTRKPRPKSSTPILTYLGIGRIWSFPASKGPDHIMVLTTDNKPICSCTQKRNRGSCVHEEAMVIMAKLMEIVPTMRLNQLNPIVPGTLTANEWLPEETADVDGAPQ